MRSRESSIEVDGPRIRALRKDRRLDMAELAKAANISQPYLSQLETGARSRCSPRVVRAIERELGATIVVDSDGGDD